MDRDTCDNAYIVRGIVAHEYSFHGPIDNIYASDIAGTDGHVIAFLLTGGEQTGKVLGVMTEVGIHFKDVVILVFQRPLEASDVGSSQSEFAATFNEVQSVLEGITAYEILDNGGCSIGRIVIQYQNVESVLQSHDGMDDVANILLFVVGRNND